MNKNCKNYLAAFAVLFLLGCSGFGGTTVAEVNGEKISSSDLATEMSMERGKFDQSILKQKTNFEAFRRQVLDKLVQKTILLSEAKRQGIKNSPEEIKEIKKTVSSVLASGNGGDALKERGIDADDWTRAQEDRAIIQKLIQKEVIDKIPVSDEKVAAYYHQHIQEYNQPAQFHAEQIILDTKEAANDVLEKLKKGGNFEDLAKEFSLSPDGKRGGDLGYFDSKTYPEIFSEVCQKLKIGEFSEVIPTDYGYQIFKLLDRREPRQFSFEEVREKIRQQLKEENSEANLETWSGELKNKVKIAINEEALKGVSLEK